jgi:hypothetical protein
MKYRKLLVLILGNEIPEDTSSWLSACKRFSNQIDYEMIDLTKSNWLANVTHNKFDVLLAKPGGISSNFKQIYDERIYLLERVLGFTVYPSAEEIFIYENKRFFSSWLEVNKLPHPKTWVFYHKNEASDFLKNNDFPVVAKTNIGASGSGVSILKNADEAYQYIRNTFSGKGATQRTGPNFDKGGIFRRGFQYILNPSRIRKKLFIYKTRAASIQRGFVIFQEFVQHDFEWRAVRIGDSFFAHKKLKLGEKASGSLLKNYDNPPLSLLDFVKEVTDRFSFYSQAIDLFETSEGKFLINEMQCIFGQSDSYQMLINGKPGRYRYLDDNWVFEEGDHARNACYDLRIEYIINKLKNI